MRILSIVSELTRAGTSRGAYNFATGCVEMGHEVAVLNWHESGPRREEFLQVGIPVYGPENSPEQRLRLASEFRPDVIHIHRRGWARKAETEIILRLRKAGRPVLETNVFGCVDGSECGDLIDAHLQLSEWCMWRWRRWHGGKPEHTPAAVVPYPIDVGEFKRADKSSIANFRNEAGVPEDAFVCGRAGFPREAKWHPAIIPEFEHLAQGEPRAFLLLAGAPPSVVEAVEALPREVRARVKLLDFITSDAALSRFYSSLDCFLHYSRIGESFGYVLAEAMLCECPVVTVNQPLQDNSQLEVVGHLDGGLVAGSPTHLGEAISWLHSDPALRTRLGRGAHNRIIEQYEKKVIIPRFLNIAALACSTQNRTELGKALLDDPMMNSEVTDKAMKERCRNTLGDGTGRSLKLAFLLHHSFVHRSHMALRAYRHP